MRVKRLLAVNYIVWNWRVRSRLPRLTNLAISLKLINSHYDKRNSYEDPRRPVVFIRN